MQRKSRFETMSGVSTSLTRSPTEMFIVICTIHTGQFIPNMVLSLLPPKLIHKPLMELRDLPHPLRPRRQKCGPEMQRPFLLPEVATRHHADAGGVEEAGAVKVVEFAVLLLGGFDGFAGEVDGREEVH